MDQEKAVEWAVFTACALLASMFLTLLGYTLVAGISEHMARNRCGHLGGKVEFYDPQHESLWRCVGARAEDPAQ